NIDAGNETVNRIKPLVRSTFTPGVLTDIGAFGAFFKPDFTTYQEPVLVSSVDGVGTKLKVAFLMDRHNTIGQDLVNHCVNDIAVCGAIPMFFMDYFSTGSLNPMVAEEVIWGFSIACRENGCALIGGETAEMPDLYAPGEYDLAGTIVGVVDRAQILDGSRVQVGDVLIGLPSTGLHTNGYSLARKVLFSKYQIEDTPEALGGRAVGEVLLDVHRSYLSAIQLLAQKDMAHAFAHITGGGLIENTKRVIPEGLALQVDWSTWDRPAIFNCIQSIGGVPEDDMRRTFNLGIGLVAVVAASQAEAVLMLWREAGEKPILIGKVV
ncbi:MAG TPA: phosphoribosylformylglycinamidine cyclo-ligase, partial [Rhodothermales bacterium]|nr:phosphoribosylformylglycinamidine cyclo-ligase [Rhodothermales bacterium]